MPEGVFVVHRGVFRHPLFTGETYTRRDAWLWLLGNAAWKPTRVRIEGKIVTVERGQLAHSVRFLAVAWKWSKSKVDRFLEQLKIETMITVETGHGTNLITICNYDGYQFGGDTERDTSGTETGTQAGHKRDKEEEVKKLRTEEKEERKKDTGKSLTLLPDGWLPSPVHYDLSEKLGLPRQAVEDAAAEMRGWSLGNGEKRRNWDWVFNNWLRRNAKNGRRGSGSLQDNRSLSQAAGRLAEAAERGEFTFGPRPGLRAAADSNVVRLLPPGGSE